MYPYRRWKWLRDSWRNPNECGEYRKEASQALCSRKCIVIEKVYRDRTFSAQKIRFYRLCAYARRHESNGVDQTNI